MRQASLFPGQHKNFHGGELVKGKRKTLRPLARRRPIHFILKSRRRDLHFRHRQLLEQELFRLATKFHLRLYGVSVSHDHIHFVARIPGRREYVAFIRSFTGIMARRLGVNLWRLLPFSRVLSWGRDYHRTKSYLEKNRAEADGIWSYEPRRDWYRRYRGSA